MTITQKWDRHSILAELRRRNMTLAELAKAYQLPSSSVQHIWTRPNEKAERAIADFIGLPVEQIFFERYPKSRRRIFKAAKHAHTDSIKHSPLRGSAA
ncbi:helix-turn-helix domain-containing protein [Bartonella rattaustraliani]|uniref:helix-turn-helix domain-containing protein n=1 Tax=Bartonella rattaustraliani TaxID=481139 RepID=UPI000315E661|nr:helix-turn-helix transcriptional regulator [Bartonella rattaustraliani]